jgi:PAS domain S-box-containing protein
LAEGGLLHVEYRVTVAPGDVRWIAVKAHHHASGGGRPERILGVLTDITQRKKVSAEIARKSEELARSQEALQHQTRILQLILDSMSDAVAVADRSGKFLVFNPAAEKILGRGAFEGGPRNWSQFYGVFQRDTVTPYPSEDLPLARAIRGESVEEEELFLRPPDHPDGIWISISGRPLRDEDGDLHGGVVVFRDISASRRAEDSLRLAKREAESANQAKSEFLSRMSHELRTPLNSILGFAQLLEFAQLTERDSENVQHILKAGYHLLELINEVLDLARIEAGRLSLSPEPVRMREALRDALDLIRPLAIQRNVSISPEVAIRCARHVHADRQRLKQVLLNLLSNAVKFNRSGGSVALSCEETPEHKLRIEVTDTGPGIAAERLDWLFKPFERLGADLSGIEGTGLGLALSKRLVEAMGGSIGVDSTVGAGSRFYIELCLLEDPTETLAKDEPAIRALQETDGVPESSGTVLYIEDNLSNLRLMEQILSHRSGVKLLSAMQGQLGLDLAHVHTPDWILLDLHLPDLPGEEVLRRLRADPRTQAIPVTVISADATPGQIDRLTAAGAQDYLTKPVDVRKLLRLLERTMRRGESRSHEMAGSNGQRNHTE